MDGGEDSGEIKEPDNSTVDDWLGQDVARDTEVAERVARESDTEEEAEERFEREASGEEHHRAAYPRPDDAPDGGPA
ncbi:MAG TPA: hypothetical protein VEW93_07880 [Acidimicrobiales bacterium]|nr:hypothetical protein [Acidimicrobiales bacterium]